MKQDVTSSAITAFVVCASFESCLQYSISKNEIYVKTRLIKSKLNRKFTHSCFAIYSNSSKDYTSLSLQILFTELFVVLRSTAKCYNYTGNTRKCAYCNEHHHKLQCLKQAETLYKEPYLHIANGLIKLTKQSDSP